MRFDRWTDPPREAEDDSDPSAKRNRDRGDGRAGARKRGRRVGGGVDGAASRGDPRPGGRGLARYSLARPRCRRRVRPDLLAGTASASPGPKVHTQIPAPRWRPEMRATRVRSVI